jgi:hypothetical protein
MAKKMTATQVRKAFKTITTTIRKLAIDRMDYGTASMVGPSAKKLFEFNEQISRRTLNAPRK